MAIKMVREPSATPNITNIDDFIGLRYAYGDQNGYCLNKGRELDYQISGTTFTVLSGRLVIQGVECDIDANGVSITVDSVSGIRYHTVYAEVSLATMSVSVKSLTSTVDYPEVVAGDNLTENTTGVARLALYHLQSNAGNISSVTKAVNPIKHTLAKTMTTVTIPARTTYAESFTLQLKPDTMYLMQVLVPATDLGDLEGRYTCFLTTPPADVPVDDATSVFFSTPMYAIWGNYSLLFLLCGSPNRAGSYDFVFRKLNHYNSNKPAYMTEAVTIQYCEI